MIRDDLTVIYYTSNREKPEFEDNIKQSLLNTIGDLPLISVSQKPIDFGENICVGDIGFSIENAFEQLKIGAQAAKTKFVCACESDTIYPVGYFKFQPIRSDCYYVPKTVYVLLSKKLWVKRFVLKALNVDNGIIADRQYLIGLIKKHKVLLGAGSVERFSCEPLLAFKTDNNLHHKVPYKRPFLTNLDGHGSSHEVLRRYCA